MKCALCPVPGRLVDGRSNLARVPSPVGAHYVCAQCARNVTMAWARKVRAEAVPPPPPGKPTGAAEAPLLAVAS
jgi:hypothetical protein